MKKLLVTLLVAATSINFVACGSSDKGDKKGEENTHYFKIKKKF